MLIGLALTYTAAMLAGCFGGFAFDLLSTRFRDASDDLRQVGSNQTFHGGRSK